MSSVDVLVPCYNYARFLERAVGSVLSQDGVDVRVLIVDDASSDETPEVGRRLAARDPRVRFRRHEVNQGHIATYNEGLLGWASADYSVMLSADDALTPGALVRAVRLLNRHPDVGMVYGRARVINDDADATASEQQIPDDYQIMSGATFLHHCCAVANPVPAPAVVVRTALQQRLGGYRPHLPHSGDMEMWMRFATQGSIGVLRAVQAYYGWHGGNMGATYYEAILGDLNEHRAACADVLKTYGSHVSDAERLLETANRHVGEQAFWMASKAFNQGDLRRSRICLQFAVEHHRNLRWSRMWLRFQAKSLIGHQLWRRIDGVVNGIRGVPSVPSDTPSSHFTIGETTGWWPGAAR
jgi:hypothetical protein